MEECCVDAGFTTAAGVGLTTPTAATSSVCVRRKPTYDKSTTHMVYATSRLPVHFIVETEPRDLSG